MKKIVSIDRNLKPDSFIQEPRVILVTKFNEESYKLFEEDLTKIRAARQSIIPIVIDSFGGAVYSLLGMISLLQDASETIVTYCGTKAMSCGAILLSCGTPGYRFLSPHASVMIHSVSSFADGKIGDIEVSIEHSRTLNDRLFKILSKNAQKESDHFKQVLKDHFDRDVFLNAEKTVELGIADHIKIPTFHVDLTPTFSIK